MSVIKSIWYKSKKWLIIGVIIIIIFFSARSCYYNIQKTRNENLRQWEEDSIRNSKIIWEDIGFEKEKAVLIAISLRLKPDTSVLIIKDYLKSYESNIELYTGENNTNIDSLLTIISNKYKVNKQKTATLIYVYKHGTIVKFEDKSSFESEDEDDSEY